LNFLFKKAKVALEEGKNVREIRNQLNNFMSSNIIYEKALLTKKAKEIKSYLDKLENYSSKKHFQNSSFDFS
jgi:hypothetical protein